MKRFTFRLDRLLKLKERAERLKLMEHAEANRRVVTQDRYLRSLNDERLRQSERQRSVMSGVINVTALRSFSRYYHKLHSDRIAGENLRSTLKKDERIKHDDLALAAQEKKTLEKYRDREESRYYKKLEKVNVAEQDESTAQRFIQSRARNDEERSVE